MLIKYRNQITAYITKHPEFLTSLVPMEPSGSAPEIIRDMCRAASLACVGPMAAVAGAVSSMWESLCLNTPMR